MFKRSAICPSPEPDQSSPRPPFYFLKIYFNIIFPSVLIHLKLTAVTLSGFSHENPVRAFPLPHTGHMQHPFKLYLNNVHMKTCNQKEEKIGIVD
jgi:hypothetical protein